MSSSESSTEDVSSSKTSSAAENSNTHSPPQINLTFPHAAQPDIIRANQKDVYYQSVLEEQVTNVFRLFFGTQTLGEEYCDIIQISESIKKTPPVRVSEHAIWRIPVMCRGSERINKIRKNVRSAPRVKHRFQDRETPGSQNLNLKEF
ncbi:12962_t:CDS:2, partial [Acaulospora colombiana]